MKKLILMMAAVLLSGAVWAQTDSVTNAAKPAEGVATEPVVQEGVAVEVQPAAPGAVVPMNDNCDMRPAKRHHRHGPCCEPQYVPPTDTAIHMSRRQEMRYFGHNFSSWFMEVKYLWGRWDNAIGMDLMYVPEIWGGYISGYYGYNANWGTVGAACRLSRVHDRVDCIVYGGLVAGYGYGGELGMRISAAWDRRYHKFSWLSASVGVMVTSEGSFVTCGVSLPFGVPTAALCVW